MGSNNIVISSTIQYYLNPFFIRIIQDLLVAEPDTTVEKEIKSEADIGYNELCPFKQYSISTKYIVNKDGDSSTMTYSSYAMSLLLTSDIRHTIIQMALRSRILFLKKNSVKSNQLNQAKKSVTRQSLPTYIRKDSKSWHLLLKTILHLVNY